MDQPIQMSPQDVKAPGTCIFLSVLLVLSATLPFEAPTTEAITQEASRSDCGWVKAPHQGTQFGEGGGGARDENQDNREMGQVPSALFHLLLPTPSCAHPSATLQLLKLQVTL